MTRNIKSMVLGVLVALGWVPLMWAGPADEIPYPTGYRRWTHVKSALIGPESPSFAGSGGVHHIYANEKAMV